MWCFESIFIALEGSGAHVSEFDDDIVVFLADGLHDGVDEGQTDLVRARTGLFLLFLILSRTHTDRTEGSI
jgi:hypothetical protein